MLYYFKSVKKGIPFSIFITFVSIIFALLYNDSFTPVKLFVVIYSLYFLGIFFILGPLAMKIYKKTLKELKNTEV